MPRLGLARPASFAHAFTWFSTVLLTAVILANVYRRVTSGMGSVTSWLPISDSALIIRTKIPQTRTNAMRSSTEADGSTHQIATWVFLLSTPGKCRTVFFMSTHV
jgi:hypothetical protein